MAILRKSNKERFTTIPQTITQDDRLSLRDVGLLVRMLSLPDNWNFSEKGLEAIFKQDGQTSIRSGLKNLEECGYLRRTRTRNEKGQVDNVEWFLYEYPLEVYPRLENQSVVFPNEDIPNEENPNLENHKEYNTKEFITKELITKEEITKEINTKEYNYIVPYLNEQAGTSFRASSKATQRLINARLNEGFTVEDFKTVIDKKCAEWLNTDWQKFLRPETLFGSKFEGYLNAPVKAGKTYGATGVEIKKPAVDDLAGIL